MEMALLVVAFMLVGLAFCLAGFVIGFFGAVKRWW